MKVCASCANTRALYQFGLTNATEDGRHIYCWPCRADHPECEAATCLECGKTKKLYAFPNMDASGPCRACVRRRSAAGRRCSGCMQAKPASEFHRNASSPDGLASECKICVRTRYDLNREPCGTCQRPTRPAGLVEGRCARCRRRGKRRDSSPERPVDPAAFKKWRKTVGLSLRGAADRLGVSHETVRNYETGEACPGVATRYAMSAVLAGLPPYTAPGGGAR